MTNQEVSFGLWIRKRRKALDITQRELALRVGCSDSLIFKIESDERRPSRQIAVLLADLEYNSRLNRSKPLAPRTILGTILDVGFARAAILASMM